MMEKQPSALVVACDARSRQQIGGVLRAAGFAVAARAQSRAGLNILSRRHFDLMVVAGERRGGSDALVAARRARDGRPGIKLLLLAPEDATPVDSNDDDVRVVTRPLDKRRLGAVVLALMAAEETGPASRDAAELGVVEAQLACLFNRHAEAERRGATIPARDIAHQIGDAMACRQALLQSRSISLEGARFSA
jgi:DNA-binding response OmpR family regulator